MPRDKSPKDFCEKNNYNFILYFNRLRSSQKITIKKPSFFKIKDKSSISTFLKSFEKNFDVIELVRIKDLKKSLHFIIPGPEETVYHL